MTQHEAESTIAQTARFYSAIAADFDADYYSSSADPCISYDVGAFEGILTSVLENLAPSRILEVGSGTGHWLNFVAAKGHQALGIDLSIDMCIESRRRITLDTVAAVQAQADRLPISDAAINMIISPYCALDHCEAYRSAFSEIQRVATSGSAIVLMVDNADRFIRRYWHVSSSRVRSLKSDPRNGERWLHEVDGATVSVYTKMFSVEEIRTLLPDYKLSFVGLGVITPMIPHLVRRKMPGVTKRLLRTIKPLEEMLCRRYPGRAALLIVCGERR